jgi:hypothetical protein
MPAAMASFSIRLLAGAALLLVLFWLFRLAMGLRWAKVRREAERRAEEAAGRRLVAELPDHGGALLLLFEEERAFHWDGRELPKAQILGLRLMLNGRVVDERSRPDAALPAAGWEQDYDGRERWDVLVHLVGDDLLIPCGSLREGVSREAAQQAFAAMARALEGGA